MVSGCNDSGVGPSIIWNHSLTCNGGFVQIVKETLPALQKLKKEGLVRHIGITGLPLKIYHYVIDRSVAHGPPIATPPPLPGKMPFF